MPRRTIPEGEGRYRRLPLFVGATDEGANKKGRSKNFSGEIGTFFNFTFKPGTFLNFRTEAL